MFKFNRKLACWLGRFYLEGEINEPLDKNIHYKIASTYISGVVNSFLLSTKE